MTKLAACLGFSLYRFCQCAFYSPAFEKTAAQATFGNSDSRSPICLAHCFPLERQQNVCSLVASLLSWGCPVAVSLPMVPLALFTLSARIMSFVVSAFDTKVLRRLLQHVRKECLKRVTPALAHSDMPLAVVPIGLIARVAASVLHVQPRAVFCRLMSTVSGSSFTCMLALETSARCATSVAIPSQFRARYNTLSAAFTSAEPPGIPLLVFANVPQNSPSSEVGSPGQVFHSRRNSNTITSSHENTYFVRVVRTASQLQLIGCSYFSSLTLREQR